MRIGLALPHYDFSVPAERPLRFGTVAAHARRAADLGFDSLWVSDHLGLSIEKYGGGSGEHFAFEPLTTLAALSRLVSRPRLGTLVLCEALRPASVAAKALATLDQLCGGRLDIGVGAGWYEPDYTAIGLALPAPGERLARLDEALVVLDGLLRGGPLRFEGRVHRVLDAPNHPPARQSPRPPLIVGGKGDRLLRIVAERADGWNTCWAWTPAAYRERAAALERACTEVDRDPAVVTRSLGLYSLVGEDGRDLQLRFERMRSRAPGGMLDGMNLDDWRRGRLVGTTEEVAAQVATWAELGVDELICCAGPLPFSVSDIEDLDVLAAAAGRRAPAGG